jgi:hypothetical protein
MQLMLRGLSQDGCVVQALSMAARSRIFMAGLMGFAGGRHSARLLTDPMRIDAMGETCKLWISDWLGRRTVVATRPIAKSIDLSAMNVNTKRSVTLEIIEMHGAGPQILMQHCCHVPDLGPVANGDLGYRQTLDAVCRQSRSRHLAQTHERVA